MDKGETNSYCSEEITGRMEDAPCRLQACIVSREIQGDDRRV